MKHRYLAWLVALILVVTVVGCGPSKPKVERIDLDKVISIMMETLKGMDKEVAAPGAAVGSAEKAGEAKDKEGKKLAPITGMDAEKEKLFLTRFAENLNKAHLKSTPIGVAMLDNGAVEGFDDPNENMKRDGSEKVIFRIHIDKQRDRVIASDPNQGYHRDHSLSTGLGGLMMGYMIGRMLNRQSASGFDTRQFEQMKASPPASQAPAPQKSVATGKTSEEKSAVGTKKPTGGSRGFAPKSKGSRR
ncbi:MAG: hypothetical protein FJ118_14580 [Deltaproteobacteria bacterium]|nr:hypothetical protein [Deltaproteobacteria bacterium]